MSSLSELRARAARGLSELFGDFEPAHRFVPGILGDVTGTVYVPGRAGYVYVRLLGDAARTVRAQNMGIPAVADESVWVEIFGNPGDREAYRIPLTSIRVLNSLWIDAGGIKAPGAKPATSIAHGVLETPAWQFANQGVEANQETISFNKRIPYRMDKTVAPNITLAWSADGVSPGNCEWQIEYLWRSPGEDTSAAAQETLTVIVAASATANGLVISPFSGIDIPSSDDLFTHCRLKRLSAGVNDTIADTVELHGIWLTWTSNKLGKAVT